MKKQILTWIDQLRLVEVFEVLDAMELPKAIYAQLKKEFMMGKDDINFLDRLKVLVNSLPDNAYHSNQSEIKGSGNVVIQGVQKSDIQLNIHSNADTSTDLPPQDDTDSQKVKPLSLSFEAEKLEKIYLQLEEGNLSEAIQQTILICRNTPFYKIILPIKQTYQDYEQDRIAGKNIQGIKQGLLMQLVELLDKIKAVANS